MKFEYKDHLVFLAIFKTDKITSIMVLNAALPMLIGSG